MTFHGFQSIAEYEKACLSVGFRTSRVLYDGPEQAFLFITCNPGKSEHGVDTWHLFSLDESREIIEGGGIFNGIDEKRIESAGFTKKGVIACVNAS